MGRGDPESRICAEPHIRNTNQLCAQAYRSRFSTSKSLIFSLYPHHLHSLNSLKSWSKLSYSALQVSIRSSASIKPSLTSFLAGGIGQPLALLLKANPLISEVWFTSARISVHVSLIAVQLGLYDIVNTPGVAADLSHISTPAKVQGFLPPDEGLKNVLTGADVVVIPAGVPRKPGVRDRVSLFDLTVSNVSSTDDQVSSRVISMAEIF